MSAGVAAWLDGTLAGLLPTAEHDWLLRAGLDHGPAGEEAWRRYRAHIRDPRERIGRDPRTRIFAPLLYRALRHHDPPNSAFQTYLRVAYLRELLRTRERQRIVGTVLAALADADVEAIALGETALAETVYEEPALRHSGPIDLLLRDADVPRAARVARSLRFTPVDGRGRATETRLLHETGLALVMGGRLFRWPCYGLPEKETWARSQTVTIAGVPVRVLSPADGLAHVCGNVFDSPGASLQWAADAWCLVRRSPMVDWNVLREAASRGRLALALAVTLGYLTRALGASIPANVLAALRELAAGADPLAHDMALMAARRGSWRGLWETISRAPGWTGRMAVVGRTLVPSPEYVRLTATRRPGPAAYLRRVAHHVHRAARAAVRAGARRLAR